MNAIHRNRWLLLLICQLGLAGFAQATQDTLATQYLRTFTNEPPHLQIQAAERLEWLGLSDTRLYDRIEQNLLASYQDNAKERANYASWMAKALGFSGQDQYRETLARVAAEAANKNTRKHAQQALDNLARYKAWNRIIGDTGKARPDVPSEHNGYANMLRSDDHQLQRLAAKRIYNERIREDWLLALLESRVRAVYAEPIADKAQADSIAYMLKALAVTGSAQYRPLVEDAAQNGGSPVLRKHAAKYLKSYY